MATRTRIVDLELVIALSEEGTLSQAASRMGMTQPALSKRLHVIERRLQVKLFETKFTGTDITESGRSFVEYAEQSVNLFYRAIQEARQAKHAHLNRLRIGVAPFQPPHLIEMLRTTELRLYRNLSVEVESAFSCDLIRKLQRKEIDVALVTSPPAMPSVTTTLLNSRRYMIVFHAEHELAKRESVSLGNIAAYPWVFFSRHVHPYMYDLILRRANSLHLEPQIVHRVVHAEQVPALIKDRRSIGWVTPNGALPGVQDPLISRPLVDPQIRHETRLATLANNESALVSEYVRGFMKRYQLERQPIQMALPMDDATIEKTG